MGKQNDTNDDEDLFVTVNLDDGESLECQVLTIFDINDQDYVVLLPVDENENPEEDSDVIIYRYYEDEDGNPQLDNIESDEEWEMVEERFDEYLDELEYEDLDDEE